ncbi:NYN domain-containing protein [Ponticaulis sp.]|uniref:LabA-like NYN domain-containing protein n=1 Tax=Ponticaulis sp. TaxID=2020902 RepID=UPI000C5EFFF5|nr:NYN domain-containing protein [Ponticaulis sp.]MAJ08523.1 NYN domain-containing protein [Ponticaulis sp.]
MAFYQNERVALFIDGANLYSAAKTVGVEIDYRKLLEEFRKRGRLIRAYYFTALVENDDYSPIRPLVDWLQYNGFNVITKSAREFTDRDGRRRVKGDMDVEITVDMMNLANHLDHIVLFSGDGDLTRVVQAVKDKGVRVSVVSTVKTQPAMISDDLRRAADTFIDLTDLAKLIGRPPRDDEQSSDYGDEEDDD